ncbi:DUF5110 domain-containing protein [Pseudonocardiaceae bacterium YIM PH 21723]|nr:DUF5110 domain-containing protein [Pseudonocardiaceae bacterium YIM PH 21723]
MNRFLQPKLVKRCFAVVLGAALIVPFAPAASAADTTIGAVSNVETNGSTTTFTAGSAKVRVVFQRDDVFRIWLAPTGTFTDPNDDPAPGQPNADMVVKRDYPAVPVTRVDLADRYELRTAKAVLTANRNPLRFSLSTPDGRQIWSEAKGLTWTGSSASQSLSRGATEQYLGGGMQNGRFSHRDQTLKILPEGEWEDGDAPNPSPYYMSSAGYGVFRNTFTEGSYAFTEPVRTTHKENRFDAYYFVGDYKTSLDRYTELTGRPFLPPIYGLEYGDSDCYNRGHYLKDPDTANDWKVQGANTAKQTTADAVTVAQKFVDNDMPRGWMLVNDDYGCGYSNTTDYVQNPDPNGVEKYIGTRDVTALTSAGDELRKRGIQMGLWTESKLDKQPEEVGKAGVRVRKLDVAWVGAGYRWGLTGCDEAYKGIENNSDARGYSWMVSSWAGAQRCAVQWTGDHSGSLGAIKWQIPAIHGSGNSGMAYTAGDVDGIFGGSSESYVRDMQWKVFTPAFMTMSGWQKPAYAKQPWSFGDPYTSINRKYLKLRERLLPYLYSYAAKANATGVPIARSLPLEYPDDAKAYGDAAKYEFMVGSEFLVAPMFDAGSTKNNIYLPKGQWIDYWSGDKIEGPVTINGYNAPLDKLPLFVKAGSVVPMYKAGINNHSEQAPGDRLTVDVYPSGATTFDRYEDDGVTRAHRTGGSATQKISVLADKDIAVNLGAVNGDYAGKPAGRPYELTIHSGSAPGVVTLGGQQLSKLGSKAAYDAASTGWFFDQTDRGGVLYVKTPSVASGQSAVVTATR